MEQSLDELDWEETAMTAVKWARLFGGSIAVLLVNDGGGLEEPLDWKNIKSIDDIRVYDRSVIQPDYSTINSYDPADPFGTRGSRLGMPESYHVTSRYGSFKVHDSRCLVFQNGVLPENCTNSVYQLWGMPEYVRIHRAIRNAELAHESAPKMLDKTVQPVYKMKNLSSELSTEDGETALLKRLQAIDLARGILNSIAIDSEGEDYDFKTFQFSGVAETIDATCNYLSALTSIPQTILFGRSPAGMNSTGESDMENYYNYVERIQKRMLKSNLRYLLSIIFQAGLYTGEIDEMPPIKIKFNPLWSLTDKEQAEVEQAQAAAQQTRAATVQMYVDMGVIDPSEVRRKLAENDIISAETMLDDYTEEELFGPAPGQPESPPMSDITTNYSVKPPQGGELDVTGCNEGGSLIPDSGNSPDAAPAATKLPEDFTDEEIEEMQHADETDFQCGNPEEYCGNVLYKPGLTWDSDKGGWITINGTHVLTNESGDITHGPQGLKKASVEKKLKAAKEACARYPSTVKGFKHKTREQLKKMPMPNLMAKTMELAKWSYTHGKMSQWNTLNPENGELSSALVSLMVNASRTSLMKDYLAFQKDYESSQKKDNADELPEDMSGEEKEDIITNGRGDSAEVDGGEGSGNWGHEGRPGEVGGSGVPTAMSPPPSDVTVSNFSTAPSEGAGEMLQIVTK